MNVISTNYFKIVSQVAKRIGYSRLLSQRSQKVKCMQHKASCNKNAATPSTPANTMLKPSNVALMSTSSWLRLSSFTSTHPVVAERSKKSFIELNRWVAKFAAPRASRSKMEHIALPLSFDFRFARTSTYWWTIPDRKQEIKRRGERSSCKNGWTTVTRALTFGRQIDHFRWKGPIRIDRKHYTHTTNTGYVKTNRANSGGTVLLRYIFAVVR